MVSNRTSTVAASQAPAATPAEVCQDIWDKVCEVASCIWEAIKGWFCCGRTEEPAVLLPFVSTLPPSVTASISSVTTSTSPVAVAETVVRSGPPALDYSYTATIEAALQQIRELFRSRGYQRLDDNAIGRFQELIWVYKQLYITARSRDVGLVFSESRIDLVVLGRGGQFRGSKRQVALDGTIYYAWRVEPCMLFESLYPPPSHAATAAEAPSQRGPSLDYSYTATLEAALQQIKELLRSSGYQELDVNAFAMLEELIAVYMELYSSTRRFDVGLVFGQGRIDLVVLGEGGSFSGSQFQRAPDGTAYYTRRVQPYGPRQ